MKLDKERTGWGLSVRTDLPEALLKEKMNLAAECMRDIFVPSDVVREGDRYTFYISHRQSLKEFISENGIGVRDFFALLQRIGKLFEDAQEHGLKPHEFIFDYECIFVGDSPEDLEFIYAPDADAYKDGIVVYNKCSDLAALVSLHIEYGTAEQEEKAEAAVTEVLRLLSEWETELSAEDCAFPTERLAPFLEQWGSLRDRYQPVSSWGPLIGAECFGLLLMAIWMLRNRGEEFNGVLTAAWLLMMVCAGYLLFPEKKRKTHNRRGKTYKYHIGDIRKILGAAEGFLRNAAHRKEACGMELNGDMLLKGIKYTINEEAYDEVRIGRDDAWADVPVGLTFVSRKHATLYKQDDKWYIKDLKSTNGTYVDGAKIIPEQPLSLKNGSEISLGIPETKFIFCLP
ncbi:MAG TPA: FHA domain-containing protein [Candidatus Egerieisoma faecipullorum]|uniref:FHA domain-containing protein n=1 Tax=Candidatus Egerieisoma faecipullorum TaxID=2840963 RepID=A0A9D1L8J2_9CLOT|nr:FHA domain-containing protein [Candidatus Egerieisoma faecipullorum]